MTTYNTGNPIGSTDPRDLYDNAQNLDTAMHTAATTWADRLGNLRPSWAGATGYQSLGDYAAGIQVTTYNQVIRAAGEYWRAAAGTALPYTATGAGMPESGKFVSVGDAVLRADLIDGDGSSIVGFQQAGSGAVVRTAQDKMREWVSVKDFGAVGDNVADDTAAVSNAINFVQSVVPSQPLYFPPGYYRITGALPDITKPMIIRGAGPRSSLLMFSGSSTCLFIRGDGERAADVKIRDIGLHGLNMAGGYAVEIDFAQSIVFDDVLIADPYNGVSIRQTGNIVFNSCLIDGVRGSYGVFAYGANAARNGENDQIDVLIFQNSVIQGKYVPGFNTSSAELLALDGRVHTVQFDGLRLLSAKRGLVTLNSPGLPSNFYPRFLTGTALEIESMVEECAKFDYCMDFWVDNLFVAGSASSSGVVLGQNVLNWNADKGLIASNWMHGVLISGAADVTITSLLVFNNSQAGDGLFSAVAIDVGGGSIDIRGGLLGKASWLPAYSEKQKYGIDISASFSGLLVAHGVDMRGNNIGAVYSSGTIAAVGSKIDSCPGYNPAGASLVSVGASPFYYTAGLTAEAVSLYGGTGVVASVDGVVLANSSPGALTLQPRQVLGVSYASAPTMAVNRA